MYLTSGRSSCLGCFAVTYMEIGRWSLAPLTLMLFVCNIQLCIFNYTFTDLSVCVSLEEQRQHIYDTYIRGC